MNNYDGAEFVVTPETVHVLMEHIHDSRRIYTDGRAWPAFIEPSFNGYSIGKWVDDGNTGQYNVLEVESRGFKGPRSYDNTGLPLHPDNQSVFKERIYLDKSRSQHHDYRDHDHRQCIDAAVVHDQEISPVTKSAAFLE